MARTDSAPRPSRPIFPRLSGGPQRLAPAEVARHQRTRLEGAMVEAVARHGFAGTTLRELVALAGVSKSTFYEHFENKQECFLATFDEIAAQLAARVGEAYRSGAGLREQLVAGLSAFMELAVEEPAAASLAAVESLTLGAASVPHRERAAAAFEALIRQGFERSPSQHGASPLTVRAMVAGIHGVAYRRLRATHPEQLPGLVEELADWMLGFQLPDGEATRRAVAAASAPLPGEPPAADAEEPEIDWEEPPDSARSRAGLEQRERIMRAAARVVVEKGYEALSIPAISAAAGTSNQTFYEHFECKRDAFLAAFDALAAEAVARCAAACSQRWDEPAEAIGAGLRALFEHISRHELFARLAFFELPAAGPVALDSAEATMDGLGACLNRSPQLGAAPPAVLEAVPSAIWTLIQHEIVHGRRESLPQIAPDAARFAIASLRPA